MTPYYADDWLTVWHGDCREAMAAMEPESVHCVVTSPPYWGLRDYGTLGQLGLERTPEEYVESMVAVFREVRRVLRADGTVWLNMGDSYASGEIGRHDRSNGYEGEYQRPTRQGDRTQARLATGLKPKDLVGIPWRVAFALQADGWVLRSEIVWSKPNPMPESVTDRPTKSHEQIFLFSKGKRIGPEPTKYDDISDADAQWIAGLFDCEGSIVIRREQPTDTGQQHAAQVSIGNTSRELLDRVAAIVGEGSVIERQGLNAPMFYWQQAGKRALGLLRRLYPFLVVKQRQARCAIALEERKWVRGGHKQLPATEIEWRERCWEAVKSLNHFGDPDLSGIPEPVFGRWTSQPYYFDTDAVAEGRDPKQIEWRERYGETVGEWGRRREIGLGRPEANTGLATQANGATRNIRSVWTIATQPYPGAHFATFPPKLVEPCIKAGTSEKGVCPECGAPWTRDLQVSPLRERDDSTRDPDKRDARRGMAAVPEKGWETERTTIGWRPSCRHAAEPIPATVLDLFAGSGTTGMVAQSLSRRAVLIDLSLDYLGQLMDRNRDIPLGLGA